MAAGGSHSPWDRCVPGLQPCGIVVKAWPVRAVPPRLAAPAPEGCPRGEDTGLHRHGLVPGIHQLRCWSAYYFYHHLAFWWIFLSLFSTFSYKVETKYVVLYPAFFPPETWVLSWTYSYSMISKVCWIFHFVEIDIHPFPRCWHLIHSVFTLHKLFCTHISDHLDYILRMHFQK